jgi:hypothetical protein
MDQLVIDLRFLMVKSSSYRARSIGLGGSSPFRRGKNHDLIFNQDSNVVQDAMTLMRLGSGRWGPSLATPCSGVREQLSNLSTGQPSNS